MYRIGVLFSVVFLGVFAVGGAQPWHVTTADTWLYAALADESPLKPTALIVGGKGGYAELTDEQMRTAFGGLLADYERVNVPFPGSEDFGYSIDVAADNLYAAVKSTTGVMLIGAVSQGAPAIPEVLRRLMDDPDRPLPSELTAMVYSYPVPLVFLLGGVRYVPFPETPYDVLNIRAEYDGLSDFPDNWFNILAVVNAIMGGAELHVDRAFFDVRTQPTKFVEVTNRLNGTTTYVLIPTPRLPLLTPWAEAGFSPAFLEFMDALLRPIVDSAHLRPRMELGIPEILKPPPTPDETPAPAPPATAASVPQVTGPGEAHRVASDSGAAPAAPEAQGDDKPNGRLDDGGPGDRPAVSDPAAQDGIETEDVELDLAETFDAPGGADNDPSGGDMPDEQADASPGPPTEVAPVEPSPAAADAAE